MLTLKDVCLVTGQDEPVPYSPHGYTVTPDGTVYSLLFRFYHGVVIAMLRPDLLKGFMSRDGQILTVPDSRDDINVYYFQDLELAKKDELDVVRVCPTRVMGPPSFDLPALSSSKCTQPQMKALQAIINQMGLRRSSVVATGLRDMTVAEMMHIAEHGLPAEAP